METRRKSIRLAVQRCKINSKQFLCCSMFAWRERSIGNSFDNKNHPYWKLCRSTIVQNISLFTQQRAFNYPEARNSIKHIPCEISDIAWRRKLFWPPLRPFSKPCSLLSSADFKCEKFIFASKSRAQQVVTLNSNWIDLQSEMHSN